MIIDEKVRQSVQLLKEFNVDCWITFVRETALNGDPTLPFLASADLTWHSAVIISKTGSKIAIVGQFDKKSVEDLGVYDEVIGYVESIKKPMLDHLRKLNPATIAVNFSQDSEIADGLTHGMFLTLTGYLADIGMQERMVSAEPIISALRQRKSATELTLIKKAVDLAEEIFRAVRTFIKPGRTEAEIAAFMRARVQERGLKFAWDPTVCPAVFTGPDTAGAHYNPTERVVEEGHVLNIDFGVKFEEYCSDLQRTFYILRKDETKEPADVRKGFDTILTSIEDSRKALKIGARGIDVDRVCRDVLISNGYKEFPHALGHQVGRFAHDGTALLGPGWEKYGRKPHVPIEENMVFTLEPRLLVPEKGTVTIEEMVVVTPAGATYLSDRQTELILIRG
jgi:Xaa-Pro aminopeptidase